MRVEGRGNVSGGGYRCSFDKPFCSASSSRAITDRYDRHLILSRAIMTDISRTKNVSVGHCKWCPTMNMDCWSSTTGLFLGFLRCFSSIRIEVVR